MTDLDKSGQGFQQSRVWLGPSLGWAMEQVQSTTTISVAGMYIVKPGDSLLLVDTPGAVMVKLPDVAAWVKQTANQPATGFTRGIAVKDLGGNAASSNITISPFGVQTIDKANASVSITQAHGVIVLLPLIDLSGWVVVSGGTGGAPPPPGGGPISSAGVFDSNGRLVRTIWTQQLNDTRVSNPAAAWDGTLDNGAAAPIGNYTVKLFQHAMTYLWEGVIGNSSHRADLGTTNSQGQTATPGTIHYHTGSAPIWDMDISAAGDMFYTTVYDERWDTAHYTKTSDPQVTDLIFTWAGRTTNTDQQGVCTDGTLTYFARMPQGSNDSFCICCNSGDKSTYSGFTLNGESDARLIGHDTGPPQRFITGQAVQQTGTNLALARESLNQVWTLNKTNGQSRVKNTTWLRPRSMATNKVTDQFWLLFSSTGTNIDRAIKLNCDGSGNLTSAGVTITLTGAQALDIAVSPDGTTVLISMGDPISQVWAFNNSDGSVKTAFGNSGTFGQLGGYRNGPAVTNDKFLSYHIIGFLQDSITAFIAFAPDGSWWFGDPGNCRTLHFSAGNSPTFIERICFIPSFYNVGLCINDNTRLRSNWLEWKIDYSKPLDNGFNGSWTLVNNWAHGKPFGDPTYPLDQYQALKWFGTYGNGRTYATYSNSVTFFGDLYELDPVTGPRNTGARIPRAFKNVVRPNMDIQSLIGGGPGATIQFQLNQFIGFDGSNNPIWAFDMYVSPDVPSWPIVYNSQPTSDTFPIVQLDNNVPTSLEPLSNNTIPFYWIDNNFGSSFPGYINHLGGLDATTGDGKWEAHPGTPNNNGILDLHLFNKQFCDAPFFSSDVFVGGPGGFMLYKTDGTGKDIVTFYRGESWGANQTSMWDHWHESGVHLYRWGAPLPYFSAANLRVPPPATVPPVLGDLMTPTVPEENKVMSATTASNFKGMPGAAGNAAWGGIAEANGNLYLYCSDEWYNAGIHRWVIGNRNSLLITEFPTTFNGTPTPVIDPTDHLRGLPFNTVNVPMPVAGWTRNFTDVPGSGIQNAPYSLSATNVFVCDSHQSPCLTLAANQAAPSNVDLQMKRTLTRSGSGNWYLQLNFMAAPIPGQNFSSNPNNSQSAFIMEILDASNKVITRAFPGLYVDFVNPATPAISLWINNFVPIAGNGTDPVFLTDPNNPGTHTDQTNWGWSRLNAVNTLRFEGTPGQVKVTYSGLPILQTVTASAPYEAGADMTAPAFFRMRYFIPNSAGYTGFNGGAGVCGTVTKLNFGSL